MPPTIVLVRYTTLALAMPLLAYFAAAFYSHPLADLVPLWVPLGVAGMLFLVEEVVGSRTETYKDELYALLKDFGENMTSGDAVESAVHKACGWKKTGPAREFNVALAEAQSVPFAAALEHVGGRSSHQEFREVSGLLALAISAGGDVGSSIRWLGQHFATLRQTEKEFTSNINSSILMMRGIGLVVAPFMYSLLAGRLAILEATSASHRLDQSAINFYVFGAIGMAVLDGFVYGRWARMPSRLPFFLGLVYFSLRL